MTGQNREDMKCTSSRNGLSVEDVGMVAASPQVLASVNKADHRESSPAFADFEAWEKNCRAIETAL